MSPNYGGSHQAVTKTKMKEQKNAKVVTQCPWLNKGLGCNLISRINDLETTETEARTPAKANFKVCNKRYNNNSHGDDACPKQIEPIAKQTSNRKLKEDHTDQCRFLYHRDPR